MGNIKPFLVPDEINESIYVDQHILVLRCKDIQPEYLFLYLNSEVCQTILDSQKLVVSFKESLENQLLRFQSLSRQRMNRNIAYKLKY